MISCYSFGDLVTSTIDSTLGSSDIQYQQRRVRVSGGFNYHVYDLILPIAGIYINHFVTLGCIYGHLTTPGRQRT